jgi:phosphoglycolate phosphatase
MATIIFDFDGTLADTFPLVVDVAYKLSGTKPLPDNDIAFLRRLPLLEAVRQLGIPPWRLVPVVLFTRSRMHARMASVPPCAGVPKVIRELHEAGHQLFILSSNYARNVHAFLKAHHLDGYFTGVESVYYGNVWYKNRGFRRLLTRHHLRPSDCYYVGNETLDIRSAEQTGIRAIAVTWSGQDRGALTAAKPHAIITKPSELIAAVTQ